MLGESVTTPASATIEVGGSSPPAWQQRWMRAFCLGLVRLFYREISISGAELLPKAGPWLVASNHPNGLLDPIVLRIGLQRPVGFLAKSTLFGNRLGRLAMLSFGGLPAYRQVDGQDTAKNQATFEQCRHVLRRGQILSLFPEGVSHSDPGLRPFKTGAARIALSYQAQRDQQGGEPLWLVPVGLTYTAKETFRSAAALTVGQPIDVAAFAAAHPDESQAARELTALLEQRLADAVLQADSQELWRGLLAVAAWTDAGAARDLGVRQLRARRLAAHWTALSARDPGAAAELQEQARALVRMLRAVGLDDPLALEDPPIQPRRLAGQLTSLVLLAPLAAVGAALGWLPYRAVRPLARKLAGSETDLISTIKALLGSLVMALWWSLQAALAGAIWGWRAALAAALLGPLGGWVALRWGDRLELRRDALRAAWLTLGQASAAREVRQRRAELAASIDSALGDAAAASVPQ